MVLAVNNSKDGNYMSIIGDLTPREAKIILIVDNKLNKKSVDDLSRVCNYLQENDICHSDSALRFQSELKNYLKTGVPGIVCPLCRDKLNSNDNFICHNCTDEMTRMDLKSARKEASEIASETPKQKKEFVLVRAYKAVKSFCEDVADAVGALFTYLSRRVKDPKFWIRVGIAATLIIAAIVGIFLIRRANDIPGKVARVFAKEIETQGYFVGSCEEPEEGCLVYDILPSYDSLIIFKDEKNKFKGAALNMKGSDDVSRSRQAIMISRLNMAVYDDLDESNAIELVSLVSRNKGFLDFRDYQLVLILNDDEAMYYIQRDDSVNGTAMEYMQNQATDKIAAEAKGDATDVSDIDGIALVASDYSVCNEYFGEGRQILAENTLYYDTVGVSILYDANDRITYIDCDGSGSDGGIVFGGMTVGQTKEEITDVLNAQNAGFTDDGDTLSADLCYNNINMRLAVSFKDDKAALISVTLEE